MKWFFVALGCLIIFLPYAAFGAVIINEIAWMGTSISANDEWIELKNTGPETVSINGWALVASDGVPSITLTGSTTSGGFFLLERTNDSSVPNIPADLLYTGALSNSGEYLTLKDSSGATVDIIDASKGWPAGNNDNKKTMQRSSRLLDGQASGWITAEGTPRAENAQPTPIPPTPSPVIQTPMPKPEIANPAPLAEENKKPFPLPLETQAVPQKNREEYFWLVLSLVVGSALGLIALFIKKKLEKGQDAT